MTSRQEITAAAREILKGALKKNKPVVVTYMRRGQECLVRGNVKHLDGATAIITWRTNETVIFFDSLVNVEEVIANGGVEE
jgi:hypothetical protein